MGRVQLQSRARGSDRQTRISKIQGRTAVTVEGIRVAPIQLKSAGKMDECLAVVMGGHFLPSQVHPYRRFLRIIRDHELVTHVDCRIGRRGPTERTPVGTVALRRQRRLSPMNNTDRRERGDSLRLLPPQINVATLQDLHG